MSRETSNPMKALEVYTGQRARTTRIIFKVLRIVTRVCSHKGRLSFSAKRKTVDFVSAAAAATIMNIKNAKKTFEALEKNNHTQHLVQQQQQHHPHA